MGVVGAMARRSVVGGEWLAAPQGICDNWVTSLKPLSNQQKDGDGPSGKYCHKFGRSRKEFIVGRWGSHRLSVGDGLKAASVESRLT